MKIITGILAVAWATTSSGYAASHPDSLLGGGIYLDQISDDFEDPDWSFSYGTGPGNRGESENRKWVGGPGRGVPEILNTVPTPAGGPVGSTSALQIRTYDDPNNNDDNVSNQEDLVGWNYGAPYLLGRRLYAADQPLYSVSVYVPEVDSWDPTTQFALRTAPTDDSYTSHPNGEWYYPSIWLSNSHNGTPSFVVRSDEGDHVDSAIPHGGWWTLGVGFDADGIGHYYVKDGTGDLSPADKIYSTSEGNSDARMDSILYHFFSIAHPISSDITMQWIVDDFKVQIVPEPSSALLTGLALLGLVARRRR